MSDFGRNGLRPAAVGAANKMWAGHCVADLNNALIAVGRAGDCSVLRVVVDVDP